MTSDWNSVTGRRWVVPKCFLAQAKFKSTLIGQKEGRNLEFWHWRNLLAESLDSAILQSRWAWQPMASIVTSSAVYNFGSMARWASAVGRQQLWAVVLHVHEWRKREREFRWVRERKIDKKKRGGKRQLELGTWRVLVGPFQNFKKKFVPTPNFFAFKPLKSC